ncbi:MAG: YigZ family protein [Synergistaceae bacterium]|jgi:uncharacterized YigZ family protein|nr:YigZ family protein [Synergistaceae bacterium]
MDFRGTELKEGQYLSIAATVDLERTIKRSRFIASIRRAATRDEFDAEMRAIEKLYPKATHYCWAYRFNAMPILEHASDAGEPAGSAGRPILGALKKYSLSNTMAVVTRYYGGIKLGVKGLIASYGDTALMALEGAQRAIFEPMSLVRFISSYELYDILLARLDRHKISNSSIKAKFEEKISGEIEIPNSMREALEGELSRLSPGGKNFSYSISPR